MENSYGIGVANRYALFYDEDEDHLEILKSQERELEKKKRATKLEKENRGTTTGKPNTTQVRKGIKDTQNIKAEETTWTKDDDNKEKVTRPTYEKTVKFSATESREERNNRWNSENKTPTSVGSEFKEFRDRETAPRLSGFDGEGRGRGRGGFRGGRGRGRGGRGGGFDLRGKREYDRQSGSDKRPFSSSGIKPVDKREGGGAHNWGTYKEDVDSHSDQLNTTNLSEEAETWGDREKDTSAETANSHAPPKEAGASTETQENEEPTPAVEEGPKEMTLDEYKAMQGERLKPVFNIRRAGDGEDNKQWKKTYALKKKPVDENYEEESDDDADYHQRTGRQKQLLSIDIQFSDSRRGGRGRGRGGRGRGRGDGRDRDDFRSGREDGGPTRGPRGTPRAAGPRNQARVPRQVAPKVDDENDFPSLG